MQLANALLLILVKLLVLPTDVRAVHVLKAFVSIEVILSKFTEGNDVQLLKAESPIFNTPETSPTSANEVSLRKALACISVVKLVIPILFKLVQPEKQVVLITNNLGKEPTVVKEVHAAKLLQLVDINAGIFIVFIATQLSNDYCPTLYIFEVSPSSDNNVQLCKASYSTELHDAKLIDLRFEQFKNTKESNMEILPVFPTDSNLVQSWNIPLPIIATFDKSIETNDVLFSKALPPIVVNEDGSLILLSAVHLLKA